MRLPPSPHHAHSHWMAGLWINEGHVCVSFLKPQNSTSWQQSRSECSCPCISYGAHQLLIWCSTLSFCLEQSEWEHTGTVGWEYLQEEGLCVINNLPALPLSVTRITSQNNGPFCWGQPQADLIVVSGKRLSQHPILFFVRTTELCCQLQRSKSLNLCQEAVLSMKNKSWYYRTPHCRTATVYWHFMKKQE